MPHFILLFVIGTISPSGCQLVLDNSTLNGLHKWSSSIIRPHFIEATYSLKILCSDDNIGQNFLSEPQWIDFKGIPIMDDMNEPNKKGGSLNLKHIQHEDTRRVFCQLDSTTKFEHYLLVYDIPHVRLEYNLVYWTPMCLKQLIQQKATNVELLIEHNPTTLHHGLIYSIGETSCYYSDTYVTGIVTITVYCEDRAKTFKKNCDTLSCYHSKTRARLLNASVDSAKRWHEVESDPQKYPDIMSKYIRMPEFKLVSNEIKPSFTNVCPDTYFMWRDTLCLPCLAGKYYDNTTLNCSECPQNSYQPFDLMLDCLWCPENGITNSSGASDVSHCHKQESENMQFIHKNTKFLAFITVIVILYFGLIVFSASMKKGEKLEKEAADEKLLKTQPPTRVNVSRYQEVYISPGKKIIEISKADFLLEAGEKRSKVIPKLDNYAFRL